MGETCGKITLTIIITLLLVAGVSRHAGASELFSARCESDTPARPYFVTFDIAAKSVVFESPPEVAETYSGINLSVGEILSVGSSGGGKLDFALRVLSGTIYLVFDRDRTKMIWPGIDDNSLRPTLIHACTISPARSILSFRTRDPIRDPISVHCDDAAGAMYFTMDVATKRAIFERGAQGRLFDGRVTDGNDDEVVLEMNFDTPRRVVWNRKRSSITIEDGDAVRPHTVMQCGVGSSRTMMVYHERHWRR